MSEPGPLSRPLLVDTIPAAGLEVTVEASPAERERLAADYSLVSIERLVGRYKLVRRRHTVQVDGRVEASIVQTCVVTVEPFSSTVDEPVQLRFTDDPEPIEVAAGSEHESPVDAPDLIVNGRIDIGTITAEFLALSLDPYPRKPGVAFDWAEEKDEEASPFAALKGLQKPKEP